MRFEHETRWLRRARAHLRNLFPNLPGQAVYNKRLRRSEQLQALIRVSPPTPTCGPTNLWLIDSNARRVRPVAPDSEALVYPEPASTLSSRIAIPQREPDHAEHRFWGAQTYARATPDRRLRARR